LLCGVLSAIAAMPSFESRWLAQSLGGSASRGRNAYVTPQEPSPPRSSRGPPGAIGGKFSPDRQQPHRELWRGIYEPAVSRGGASEREDLIESEAPQHALHRLSVDTWHTTLSNRSKSSLQPTQGRPTRLLTTCECSAGPAPWHPAPEVEGDAQPLQLVSGWHWWRVERRP